ncbi:MAG TPA: hypothetical protein VFT66_21000 [Roseiflexaceae bacterium]|jgi:hypothetical protein|nr:hypothetical protein [Roseiflexaceae bacterium]
MPQVRKLTAEEVREIEGRIKGQRKLIEEEYDALLQDYRVGDYGEAELESDEKRITVRNRLRAAAQRREIGLEFRRTRGNTLRFKVVPSGEETDGDGEEEADEERDLEPTVVSEQSPKKRGRQKKS